MLLQSDGQVSKHIGLKMYATCPIVTLNNPRGSTSTQGPLANPVRQHFMWPTRAYQAYGCLKIKSQNKEQDVNSTPCLIVSSSTTIKELCSLPIKPPVKTNVREEWQHDTHLCHHKLFLCSLSSD